MSLILHIIFLIIASAACGYASHLISLNKLNTLWAIPFSMIIGYLWGRMVKLGYQLSYISILYDVITSITYLLTFYMLGDRLKPMQILGVVIAIAGVVIISAYQG